MTGGSGAEHRLPVQVDAGRDPVERNGDDRLPRPQPPRQEGRVARVALEWGVLIVSALLIALLIKTFLFQAFYIPSESMVPDAREPRPGAREQALVQLHPVHRGDIVVFKAPPGVDPSVKDLVKRVIALPGETDRGPQRPRLHQRQATDGAVPAEGHRSPDFNGLRPIKVPPDSYWVMGDNRPNSQDSRLLPVALHPQEGHRRARLRAHLAAESHRLFSDRTTVDPLTPTADDATARPTRPEPTPADSTHRARTSRPSRPRRSRVALEWIVLVVVALVIALVVSVLVPGVLHPVGVDGADAAGSTTA